VGEGETEEVEALELQPTWVVLHLERGTGTFPGLFCRAGGEGTNRGACLAVVSDQAAQVRIRIRYLQRQVQSKSVALRARGGYTV
jgi:hypothetical protein